MSTVETKKLSDQDLAEAIVVALDPLFEQLFEQLEAMTGEIDARLTALGDKIGDKLTALGEKLDSIGEKVDAIRIGVENQRDFQIDQGRDRHSLLLIAMSATRGSLPTRESNLTFSGTRFIKTRKDLKQASIY